VAIETELKYAVSDPAVFDRIAALTDIAGYSSIDSGVVNIVDIAFDTSDHALYHGAAVFRLREAGGKRFLTFKAHAPSDGSYYRRIEEESPAMCSIDDIAAGRLPDIPPVRELYARFGNRALTPSLTTYNSRRRFDLVMNSIHRYELALDDVTFTGPRGNAHILEIEIEALTDDHDDLDAIGAWLCKRFSLAKAGPSKFVLGMDLVGMVNR
jgi:inorganic triphosphatase YgiF